MSRREETRRAPRRTLRRESDGSLIEAREGTPVTPAQIRDELRGGVRFRAVRPDGSDCTYAVLAEILTGRGPELGRPDSRVGAGGLLGRLAGDALEWSEEERDGRRERPARGGRSRPGRERRRRVDRDPPA